MSELQHARIAELCGELRLGAVPDLHGATAQAAAARDASLSDFLEDTLRAEREVRRSRAGGIEEMVHHLITRGSTVTVVKPDALRARLAEFALRALQRHQKESD